jgi:hypothetical protein
MIVLSANNDGSGTWAFAGGKLSHSNWAMHEVEYNPLASPFMVREPFVA